MPNLSLLINNSSKIKAGVVKAIVKAGTAPARMKVLKTPADYGMEYKNVDIKSSDGIRLSAWIIRREDTKKVAIVNHPLMCTRYGTIKGVDDVCVEFGPTLKNLYTAGYSIVTYDQRGQGESDGGLGDQKKGDTECPVGTGAVEWQDVIGVVDYVKENFKEHNVALVGFCMGANSIFKCWTEAPETFDGLNLKCFVAVQPTRSNQMRARMTKAMIGVDLSVEAAEESQKAFGLVGVDCAEYAPKINVPIMICQVKADVYIHDEKSNDVQAIFDACTGVTDKKLLWTGPGSDYPFGNGLRFEGYSFFNYHPTPLIAYLDSYMGGASVPRAMAEEKKGEVVMQKDADHPICQPCGAAFTTTKRRHHCRVCGNVFCKKCSSKKVDGQRSCFGCWVHSECNKMNNKSGPPTESKVNVSIDIDAPASVVWKTVTDFNDVSWTSAINKYTGELKEGGKVTVFFNVMGLDFEVPHTVKNFVDGIQWGWGDEISHGISNDHLYKVEAIDDTHSRFIQTDKLTGGDVVVRYGACRSMTTSYEQFSEELKIEVEKRYEAEKK